MAAQYLYGDTNPQTVPILTASAALPGDLMANNSGNAINAGDWPWTTDEATTRAAFVAKYLGVSYQTKTAAVARVYGNGNDNTLGIYKGACTHLYDAASATYAIDDLLGPDKDTGNALMRSRLKKVSSESEATHVCVKATGASATQVYAQQRIPPNAA